MNRLAIKLLLVVSLFSHAALAQRSLSDSVFVLYERFFEMQQLSETVNSIENTVTDVSGSVSAIETRVDSVSGTINQDIVKINKNYEYFNEVLEDNNKKIGSISQTQLFTNKTLVERNIARTENSTEFVEAALTALNAFDLTNQVFSYTDQITALNNPENKELGFSLSQRVSRILEDEIFRGRSKVNKVRRDKFLTIVDNVLKSPVTSTFTNGLPVVGSIKSVVEMVVNVSLQGNDIDVKEVNKLKDKLKGYIEYYQGLENALRTFEAKVGGIDVKTEALKLLLKNYVSDRIKTVYPMVTKEELEASLNNLLNDYYNFRKVQSDVEMMLLRDHTSRGQIDYTDALGDSRLQFPDFAVGQARFIKDEIESIANEYEAALNYYQTSIENVLSRSKAIGNSQKIDDKIEKLGKSKQEVVEAIRRNIDLPKIKKAYQSLLWENN